MKTIELESRIRNLKGGEKIPLKNKSEQKRAYSAASTLRKAGIIDFEIWCPTVATGGWVAIRKPK